MPLVMENPDPVRIKEISEDIIKSMLARSYPVVDATHFFKKYAKDGKPEHQFAHTLKMLEEGGVLRMDTTKKPFSVTFVLLDDNGAVKMHHMIDDEYESETFGSLFNDPYEGPKKRVHCFKHIMKSDENCEKCKLETNSMICMQHGNILSKCNECKIESQLLKNLTPTQDAQKTITAILAEYKNKYWSFEK